MNTAIFMLVEHDQKIFILNYRCYPWPVQKKSIDELELERIQLADQIQLVTGGIELAKYQ